MANMRQYYGNVNWRAEQTHIYSGAQILAENTKYHINNFRHRPYHVESAQKRFSLWKEAAVAYNSRAIQAIAPMESCRLDGREVIDADTLRTIGNDLVRTTPYFFRADICIYPKLSAEHMETLPDLSLDDMNRENTERIILFEPILDEYVKKLEKCGHLKYVQGMNSLLFNFYSILECIMQKPASQR